MSPEQSENSAPRGRAGPSLLHRTLASSVQRNFPDTAVDAQKDLTPKSESAIVAQAPVPEPTALEEKRSIPGSISLQIMLYLVLLMVYW